MYIYIYIYIYISIYPPPCPWHEVGVFGHRAKRVRRCQYPTIHDVNDLRSMLSMMDWSTIVFRADIPSGRLPVDSPSRVWNHFFGFQLRLQNSSPFQSPKIHQKSSKKLRKPSPRPSQNGSKIACYLTTPDILKKCTPPIRKPNF